LETANFARKREVVPDIENSDWVFLGWYGKQTCGLTPPRGFIERMIRYGQFCPVAKTAEIFGDRWSPLIIRELCYGPRSFGDFLAALPLISRTMLSQRLKELAAVDVVHAAAKERGRGYSYTPRQLERRFGQ
jgi:DNA-binding HxlR family transcriptional regulator